MIPLSFKKRKSLCRVVSWELAAASTSLTVVLFTEQIKVVNIFFYESIFLYILAPHFQKVKFAVQQHLQTSSFANVCFKNFIFSTHGLPDLVAARYPT